MNKFIGSFLLMACFFTAQSQRVYFVYLQTENEQPFFVKMNEKVYSSAASGYLVLPKLRDSSYAFIVGFPQGKWPEQKFTVEVKGKDHGYLVKNFGEKGWGLFDLQTLAVQMSGTVLQTGKTELKEASAFTDVLSKAANDPSLRERPIQVKMEEKPVVAQQAVVVQQDPSLKKETPSIITDASLAKTQPSEPVVVKKEEPVIVKKEEPVPEMKTVKAEPDNVNISAPQEIPAKAVELPVPMEKKEEVKPVPAEAGFTRSTITRKSESSTTEGFGLTFIDEYADGKKDIINIIIPNPRTAFADNKPAITPEKIVAPAKPINKACPSVASESDFLKLRKKMAAGKDNEAMIDEAKKVYKSKCFTTAQIKNIGNLFLDDAGRYQYFDASYAHIADPGNFASLETELKEAYFINRFKALLR